MTSPYTDCTVIISRLIISGPKLSGLENRADHDRRTAASWTHRPTLEHLSAPGNACEAAMVASTVAPTAPSEPILIHLSGDRAGHAAYIFSHDDAFRCRRALRILGDFVGTLPKHTAQNQYLSLPLALSYDEALFGLSRGLFKVVNALPDDFAAPDKGTVTAFWEERRSEEQRQAEEALRQQEAERERRSRKGVKRPRENDADAGSLDGTAEGEPEEPPRKAARVSMLRRAVRSIRTALHVLVPGLGPPPPLAALPPLPNPEDDGNEEAVRKTALEARLRQQARATTLVVTSTLARPDEVLDSPPRATTLPQPTGVSSERLADRAAVFADLHDKGYYLSCGAKFGSDFLAYAGDPQLFHAALAVVVVAAEEQVSPLDVVALGRLGDSTKKRTVLAYIDEQQVQYIGVQWEETLP